MVKNFRYQQPGAVALSGVPETPEAVDWLYEQGVRAVVSLHPVSEHVRRRLEERGMAWRPFPVTSFSERIPCGIGEVMEFIRSQSGEGAPALIH